MIIKFQNKKIIHTTYKNSFRKEFKEQSLKYTIISNIQMIKLHIFLCDLLK